MVRLRIGKHNTLHGDSTCLLRRAEAPHSKLAVLVKIITFSKSLPGSPVTPSPSPVGFLLQAGDKSAGWIVVIAYGIAHCPLLIMNIDTTCAREVCLHACPS